MPTSFLIWRMCAYHRRCAAHPQPDVWANGGGGSQYTAGDNSVEQKPELDPAPAPAPEPEPKLQLEPEAHVEG